MSGPSGFGRLRVGVLAVLGLALVALTWMSCESTLGTNDVGIDYTVDRGDPATVAHEAVLRLHAARIDVDVELRGDHGLRVIVDAKREVRVENVLARPGGIVVQRMPKGQILGGVPIVAIDDATARAEDKDVIVPLHGDPLASLKKEPPDETVALYFEGRNLWEGPLQRCLIDDSLVMSRGTDIGAYYKAYLLVEQLDGPSAPAMTATGHAPLPADWPLAILCYALPIAVGIGWLFFVRRIDRARPEPWWLLLATMLLGAASTMVAGLVEAVLSASSPYLDATGMALDHRWSALPLDLLVFTLTVGCVEEGTKLIATWSLALRRREFDEPVDGIVFACAAAIGFATAENVGYFTHGRFEDGLIAARSLACVSGHMMYAAIWGYALGQRLVSARPQLWRYFLLAALLHGAWDTAATFQIPFDAIALTAVITTAFVIVLRRALRWGAVDPAAGVSGIARVRELYPVGRMGAFVLAVLATFGFAYLLMALGYSAQKAGVRVDTDLVARTAVYGTLFVISAWALATMMPLDVAVDDTGVTYAGALIPWSQLRGVERVDGYTVALAVDGEARPLRLGPGTRTNMDKLEASLRARLAHSASTISAP